MVTLAVFYFVLNGKFLNWDDYDNLVNNPDYRGLGWAHLRWMFTTFYLGNYRPLTWMTFGFDYMLWGMEPRGYHVTNLLLHGANTLLFYFIAMRLLSVAFSIPNNSSRSSLRIAAGFAALVFSIHPLRVEPVAWLSARNHLLAALFYLGTVFCYLRAAGDEPRGRQYWRWLIVAVVLYGFSLLSQPSGITLPLVLLIIDVYPLRRLGNDPGKWPDAATRYVWWEKLPFLLLALGGGLLAMLAKIEVGLSLEEIGILPWLAQALYKLTFYLTKTIIPLGLSPLYVLPVHLDPWDWPFVLSGLGVLGLTIATFAFRHRWPAGLASWLCYLVTIIPYVFLMPVIGGAANEIQVTADRYSYLACLSWALLAAGGLLFLWQSTAHKERSRQAKLAACYVAVSVLIVLGLLAWRQTKIWQDTRTLWEYTIVVSPNASPAYYNLAKTVGMEGDPDRAIGLYSRAISISPEYMEAHYNIARLLARKGQLTEAVSHYRTALAINPDVSATHNNLGLLLAFRGDRAEALEHLFKAATIDPTNAEAFYNLGNIFSLQGDLDKALQNFHRALQLSPNVSEIHLGLGNVLVKKGEISAAEREFEEAVRLNPDFADAHIALARSLVAQGNKNEAEKHYQEALRLLKSQNHNRTPRASAAPD